MTEEKDNSPFYKYPKEVRDQARMCFMAGYGYKKTASILKINVYTVRDWKREWKKENSKKLGYIG